MDPSAVEFERRVVALVGRYCAQGGREVPTDVLRRLAGQLLAAVRARGLPPPLPAGAVGSPGGMAEGDVASLVAQVSAGCDDPLVIEAARQLVKACFYPEFTICRDSYREVKRDGSCRRQELERVRSRLSGAHCVDCPYWVAQTPTGHAALLRAAWHGDPAAFEAHREVFLPEDFRAFALWRHEAMRQA